MRHLAWLVAVAAVLSVGKADASFGFCSKPNKPFCLDNTFGAKSNRDFDSCRNDMENYIREVNDYVSCLQREQNSAIEESNRYVRRFNCMTGGGTMCY